MSDNEAFAAALSDAGNPVVITGEVMVPSSVTTTRKTIIICSGGKLVLSNNLSIEGRIKVVSGGSILIPGDKSLTITDSGYFSFGGEKIDFPTGVYTAKFGTFITGKDVLLSYTDKTLTIGGEDNGVLNIEANPGGGAMAYKLINFPLGYSLKIKSGFYLSGMVGATGSTGAFPAFNFGADTKEGAGLLLSNGTNTGVRAMEGDVILTAAADGVELRSTTAEGWLWGNLYCTPGKTLRFPQEGNGAYPLTVKGGNGQLLGSSGPNPQFIVKAEPGGVMMKGAAYTGPDVTPPNPRIDLLLMGGSQTLNIRGTTPTSFSYLTFAVERTGGGSGRLSFIVDTADFTWPQGNAVGVLKGINLGGTPTDPVGRFVIKPGRTLKLWAYWGGGGVEKPILRTGNAPGGDGTYSLGSSIAVTTATVKGTRASGSGYFATAQATGNNGGIKNNGPTDFILDSTTVVTGE